MHFVLVVIAFFTAAGFNVRVSSTSTKTGIAPTLKTASKLATKVKEGMMTSSPTPIPKATIAVVKAAVPDEVSCAYWQPNVSVIAFSNSWAFHIPFLGPSKPYRIKMPVSNTSFTSFLSSAPKSSKPGIS